MGLAKALVSTPDDLVHEVIEEEQRSQDDFADKTSDKLTETQIRNYRPCFRTDERYYCTRRCRWSRECKKLIAEWLR